VFHLGGLTAQSVLATVLLVLPDWWWVDTVARFNALVFAWNLLPWRIGSVASDGWWFFGQMWAGGRTWGSLLEQRRTLEVLEEQERLRGSPVGAWYASLLLTWIDLLLGGTVETPEPPPEARGVELDALYRLVVADAHRLQGRPVPALGVIRALRADLGAEPLPGLDDLRCILEVRVWLALGEPRTALETLAQITGTGGVVAQEASVLRLAAALQDGEMDDLVIAANHLLARLDGAFLDPPGAVQILWEASLAVQKGGHIALHETLRNSARSAAWRLVERTRSVDRPKLLARLGIPELGESARDLERGGGPRGEGSAPG
jgi:hypothetical protein